MAGSRDKKELAQLRDHMRMMWRAYAAAFYNLQDILGPKREYLLNIDPKFHSIDAAAYMYLVATRGFIRTAEKASDTIDAGAALQKYREDLGKEFPQHKSARDIIEHFEDYALGKGDLQKKGQVLSGQPISVFVDDRNLIHIQVFNLEPIDMSKLAFWIDGFNFFMEKCLHEAISPEVAWKGFFPENQ